VNKPLNRRELVILASVAALAAGFTLKYAVPLIPERWLGRVPAPLPATSPEGAETSTAADESEPWTGVVLGEAVEISSRFDGKLAVVRVRPGDTVRAGDVLAELDTTIQEQEVAAAKASLRASRAEAWGASVVYSQARERATRRDGSVTVGSTVLPVVSAEEQSGARFESTAAASRASAAGAAADERKVRLEQLKIALTDSVLRAPFDGIVSARYLDPGARVQASLPIVRLVGRGALRVRFAVPEADAKRVSLGGNVSVAWRERTLEAKVDRIAPEVESSSGTIFVEATLGGYSESEKSGIALSGRVVGVRPVAAVPKG
jgi:multidrug resistance efflux pump